MSQIFFHSGERNHLCLCVELCLELLIIYSGQAGYDDHNGFISEEKRHGLRYPVGLCADGVRGKFDCG